MHGLRRQRYPLAEEEVSARHRLFLKAVNSLLHWTSGSNLRRCSRTRTPSGVDLITQAVCPQPSMHAWWQHVGRRLLSHTPVSLN